MACAQESLQMPAPSRMQICRRCALVQPPPSALQLGNRRKNARLLTDLAHTWSDRGNNDIDLSDILALAAAVYMFIKLDLSLPQQLYPRAHPELLSAVAELLTWHQPHDAPVLHTARTVQQVTRAEFHILEALRFKLATTTPAAWVEIFRRRFSF